MKKFRFIAALALGAMLPLTSEAGAAPQSTVPSLAAKTKVSVAIVGEVAKPGNYTLIGNKPTLLDLIALSGGLTRNLERVHVKVRRGARSFDINIENLIKLKVDFTLQEGDLVTIAAHRVFISGAVKTPGYYSLPQSDTLSIADALLLAGGTIEAEGNRITLLLAAKNAKPLDRYFEIQPDDFSRLLQDGDLLFVSNPKVKVSPFTPLAPLFRNKPVPKPAPLPKVRLYLLESNLAS